MADKQVTVAVPEERVAEFYIWFGEFLAPSPEARRHWGVDGAARAGRAAAARARAWSADDADQATWLYASWRRRRASCSTCSRRRPGERFARRGDRQAARAREGRRTASRGILAWPGRYSRHLGRLLPIETTGRPDGGTDYYMEPEVAALFRKARGE